MNLTNDDAQLLIDLKKKMVDNRLAIPLAGETKKYHANELLGIREFVFRMRMANGNNDKRHKATYNLFYEGQQLLRLDTYGTGPHINPDGTVIPAHTPHIHIYDEVYDDHCAYSIDSLKFSNLVDLLPTLVDFLEYAHVIDVNKLEVFEQGGLKFGDVIHG